MRADALGAARRRRVAAIASLAALAAAVGLAIVTTVESFPSGLTVALALIAAAALAWHGLQRTGPRRLASLAGAAALLAGAIVLVIVQGQVLENALVAVGLLASFAAARVAFAVRASLPEGPRPEHPVLFFNPRSGGGKAERFHLVDAARSRGIEPIELRPGTDLETLVRDAVDAGADALAMAGGDGSQAIVAAIAAELDLPYACIPAGTRNHFALDLGVDRDDVVGALDALVAGRLRRVDLAEVNGRVFVNNVSLGLYGEAVQRAGYRDAKIKTLLDTLPAISGPGGRPPDLRFTDADGAEHATAATILVSNNPYRLARAVASGTRPRLDSGQLGVAAVGVGGKGRLRTWATATFEVQAAGAVWAGVDGEAMQFEPPLVFRSRPQALRVLIALHHPGASPSAAMPERPAAAIPALAAIALGRAGSPPGDDPAAQGELEPAQDGRSAHAR